MNKNYEAIKEILDDQIKKIVKKGDISPQELESLYKASAVVLDLETREAMKQAGEGQSHNSYEQGGSNDGRSYEGQNSNHYPYYRMFYGNGSNANNGGNSGNSYGPVWNQEMREHEMSRDGRMSRENSRNDGRGNSRESYDGAYDGAYDGSYEGAYDGAYDGAYNSYRRGRDARTGRYVSRDSGYSRAMDKERMIGKLEDMMDDAPSEKERRALQQCVDKLERQ